jgi:hypothetical protein
MGTETKNNLESIEAEDLELINNHILKIELLLANKFPKTSIEKIVSIERERIFDDIEFSEMINNEFDIKKILREREVVFMKDLRSSEENQIISLFNFGKVKRLFPRSERSHKKPTPKGVHSLTQTRTEDDFTVLMMIGVLIPIMIIGLLEMDPVLILIIQGVLFLLFTFLGLSIKSRTNPSQRFTYFLAFLVMLLTSYVQFLVYQTENYTFYNYDPESENYHTGDNASTYIFIISGILFFGFFVKQSSFLSPISKNTKNPLAILNLFFFRIIYIFVLTWLASFVLGFYVLLRTELAEDTDNLYVIFEFSIIIYLYLVLMKGTAVEKFRDTQIIPINQDSSTNESGLTQSSHIDGLSQNIISTQEANVQDLKINVIVNKESFRKYASLKNQLINRKNVFFALLLVSVGSMTIYLDMTSNTVHPNLPSHVDKFIEDYITLFTTISLILVFIFILSIGYNLSMWLYRRPSKSIIYNLGVKGSPIVQSELYRPPMNFDNDKYFSLLGELIYREIVSIEKIGV